MKNKRKTSIVTALLAVCILCTCSACGKSSGDHMKMKTMADKMKAKVEEYIKGNRVVAAQNLAEASSLFAREIDCVAGKSLDTDTSASTWKKHDALMEKSEWEKRLNAIVLNPMEYPGGFRESDYNKVLRWALSDDDMQKLGEIRKRHNYWDKLRESLL